MARTGIISVVCIWLFFSFTVLGDTSQIKIQVTNPLDESREDETVSVDLGMLPYQPQSTSVYNEQLKKFVLCQAIDNDGDRVDDELIFQSDFEPGQTQLFSISESNGVQEVNVVGRTNAMFVPQRKDDFAWENDRIAFRMYGPELQRTELTSSGIDVWVKSVKYPVMKKLYEKGDDYYHHDNGEGFDFYKVGESLGCGGLGVLQGKKVYQSKNFVSWRLIANGPIRSVFELTYKPWQVGDKTAGETKRISLDLGSNFNHIESSFDSDINDAIIVVGIVKCALGGHEVFGEDRAWLSYWHNPDPVNGSIGCAVILPKDVAGNTSITTDKHNLLHVKLDRSSSIAYCAGACWSKTPDFDTEEKWLEHVRKKVRLIENPLKVEMLTK
jgi:hypothetical protein